ncbi:MAG: hypothetical protein ACRCS8_04015 [Brevinema sp.]
MKFLSLLVLFLIPLTFSSNIFAQEYEESGYYEEEIPSDGYEDDPSESDEDPQE